MTPQRTQDRRAADTSAVRGYVMRIINALFGASVLVIFLIPQALAAPPGGHLNIEEVAVAVGDPDTTIEISGTDFDFGNALEVTLAGAPAEITSSTNTTIIVTVLTTSYPAGDYLLNVSTGNGQSQNDEYDLTIGAVGPAGPAGADGTDGADGADGADGMAGADGADGADGMAGADGADGADGMNGMNGHDGADGMAGADGADGADGSDGAQGEQGPPGVSNFEILAVECTIPAKNEIGGGGAQIFCPLPGLRSDAFLAVGHRSGGITIQVVVAPRTDEILINAINSRSEAISYGEFRIHIIAVQSPST